MITLIHHIRKSLLTFSFILALGIYFYLNNQIDSSNLLKIRLGQYYALLATTFLYLALLASPLYNVFPSFPYKPIYIRARRALGLSAFFFATLHASIEFLGLLGGFAGLGFLSAPYLRAIIYSSTAYLILAIMASISWDGAVKRLGTNWKKIHRLVYIAVVLILTHALMLGTHFTDLSDLIPKIYFAALTFLLVLEAIRLDRYLATRFKLSFTFGVSLILVIAVAGYFSTYLKSPVKGTSSSLGIHANHIKLAEEAQTTNSTSLPNLPGLTGDRTKRYSVSFDQPNSTQANKPIELKFKVFDASNGNPVLLYKRPYQETFHLIIVDSTLTYFSHIHPKQVGNEFSITTTLPADSTYHLYIDFQPLEAIDQQYAFSLKVGDSSQKPTQIVDKNLTKTFGDYEVTLKPDGELNAQKMSLGQQKISFVIKDAKTKQPITNLKPYLNAFGHLVMIRQDSYEYLHVHPYELTPPAANANGGPEISFLPIGIYGQFKSGVYRVFAQFNHNGKIFVADFTVKVN